MQILVWIGKNCNIPGSAHYCNPVLGMSKNILGNRVDEQHCPVPHSPAWTALETTPAKLQTHMLQTSAFTRTPYVKTVQTTLLIKNCTVHPETNRFSALHAALAVPDSQQIVQRTLLGWDIPEYYTEFPAIFTTEESGAEIVCQHWNHG